MRERIDYPPTTLERLAKEFSTLGDQGFRQKYPCAFLIAHHEVRNLHLGEDLSTFEWNQPVHSDSAESGIQTIPLSKPVASPFKITLGRSSKNNITLDSPKVSKYHAVISIEEEYFLEDLASRNGTKINGRRLERGEVVELKSGNIVAFFDAVFVFSSLDDMVLRLTYT